MFGEVSKHFENITRNFQKNFEETKLNFEEIRWSKKIDDFKEI